MITTLMLGIQHLSSKLFFLLFYIRYAVTLNAIGLLETFINLYYDYFLNLKIQLDNRS